MARRTFCLGPWSLPKLLGSHSMWVHSDCQTMGFPSHLNGADLAPLGEVCASPTVMLLAMAVNLTGLPVFFLIGRTKQTVRPKCRPQIKRLESHFRKRGVFCHFFRKLCFCTGFAHKKMTGSCCCFSRFYVVGCTFGSGAVGGNRSRVQGVVSTPRTVCRPCGVGERRPATGFVTAVCAVTAKPN